MAGWIATLACPRLTTALVKLLDLALMSARMALGAVSRSTFRRTTRHGCPLFIRTESQIPMNPTCARPGVIAGNRCLSTLHPWPGIAQPSGVTMTLSSRGPLHVRNWIALKSRFASFVTTHGPRPKTLDEADQWMALDTCGMPVQCSVFQEPVSCLRAFSSDALGLIVVGPGRLSQHLHHGQKACNRWP